MNNNLNFFQTILDTDIINTFKHLQEYENLENNTEQKYLKEQYEQLLFTTNLFKNIQEELKQIKIEQFIIIFNNFIYKFRKFIKITENCNNLDSSISIFKNTLKQEKECLNILYDVLILNTNKSNIPKISEIYLYFMTLIIIKKNIENYYLQQLTINDSNTKGFNAQFNSDEKIDKEQESFETIKTYINKLSEINNY